MSLFRQSEDDPERWDRIDLDVGFENFALENDSHVLGIPMTFSEVDRGEMFRTNLDTGVTESILVDPVLLDAVRLAIDPQGRPVVLTRTAVTGKGAVHRIDLSTGEIETIQLEAIDNVVDIDLLAVPAPSAGLLFLSGTIAIVATRRRPGGTVFGV